MLQTVKQGWHYVAPQWEANPIQLQTGLPPEQLGRPWQMLLLGDGAATRHLQLLTGEDVEVDVLAMEHLTSEEVALPVVEEYISRPRVRRQVWLRTVSGLRLAYATSWWQTTHIDQYLENRNLGIWKSLASKRTEHFRDLRGLSWGRDEAIETAFGSAGMLWARHYLLWSHGKPITLIYEVFSPLLAQYLGPATSEAPMLQ